jgi:Fe-S-cluster containining protein
VSEPWYADGLRFSCTRCGHCCTGAPGFVWVDDEAIAAIAGFLGEPIEEVRGLYTRLAHRGPTLREKANGDCVFYDRSAGPGRSGRATSSRPRPGTRRARSAPAPARAS